MHDDDEYGDDDDRSLGAVLTEAPIPTVRTGQWHWKCLPAIGVRAALNIAADITDASLPQRVWESIHRALEDLDDAVWGAYVRDARRAAMRDALGALDDM